MQRVVFALLGEAALFAALAGFLGADRFESSGVVVLSVFIGVLAVGFPTLYYCCKHRLWEPWRAAMLGALCGVLCAFVFAGSNLNILFPILFFAVCGSCFGLAFWVAAIWRNENLTCPKSFCLPCGTAYRYARDALRRPGTLQSK